MNKNRLHRNTDSSWIKKGSNSNNSSTSSHAIQPPIQQHQQQQNPNQLSSTLLVTPESTPHPQQYLSSNYQNIHHPRYDASWEQMTRTVAHYERLEQIGEGTYGQVYRAMCSDTHQIVALKKMRLLSTGRGGYWGMPLQLIREIKILKQLQHPNLLQMIEVVTSKGVEHLDKDDPVTTGESKKRKVQHGINPKNNDINTNPDTKDPEEDLVAIGREKYKGNLFLVLEYVTHDLTGLMDVAYQFTPVQIKCIFRQLLQALEYMHTNKFVHRDIKSSNILLDSHFRLKLADFGLARSLEPPLLEQMETSSTSGNMQDLTNKVITLWYRPPEILLGTVHYTYAVDVWSAGCILAELFTGKPLAAGKSELDQLALIADLTGTPDMDTWTYLFSLKRTRSLHDSILPTAHEWRDNATPLPSKLREKYERRQILPDSAISLLEKLLVWDPRKRLTAANALQHKYFWSQPVAPIDPALLGRIEVAADGHFHEFQTKQKRRQAKQKAEEAREHAILNGMGTEEAGEYYDKVYRGIMKQVAEEGIAVETEKKEIKKEPEHDPKKKNDGKEKKERDRSSSEHGKRLMKVDSPDSDRGHNKRSKRSGDDTSLDRRSIGKERRRSNDDRRNRHRDDDDSENLVGRSRGGSIERRSSKKEKKHHSHKSKRDKDKSRRSERDRGKSKDRPERRRDRDHSLDRNPQAFSDIDYYGSSSGAYGPQSPLHHDRMRPADYGPGLSSRSGMDMMPPPEMDRNRPNRPPRSDMDHRGPGPFPPRGDMNRALLDRSRPSGIRGGVDRDTNIPPPDDHWSHQPRGMREMGNRMGPREMHSRRGRDMEGPFGDNYYGPPRGGGRDTTLGGPSASHPRDFRRDDVVDDRPYRGRHTESMDDNYDNFHHRPPPASSRNLRPRDDPAFRDRGPPENYPRRDVPPESRRPHRERR